MSGAQSRLSFPIVIWMMNGVRERRNIKRGRTKLEEREGRRRKEGGRGGTVVIIAGMNYVNNQWIVCFP
jgi:hypothetical protein